LEEGILEAPPRATIACPEVELEEVELPGEEDETLALGFMQEQFNPAGLQSNPGGQKPLQAGYEFPQEISNEGELDVELIIKPPDELLLEEDELLLEEVDPLEDEVELPDEELDPLVPSVIKLHTWSFTNGLPAKSLTWVVIVAVCVELGTRLLAGLKVTVSP
jgi:hypothetical protein